MDPTDKSVKAVADCLRSNLPRTENQPASLVDYLCLALRGHLESKLADTLRTLELSAFTADKADDLADYLVACLGSGLVHVSACADGSKIVFSFPESVQAMVIRPAVEQPEPVEVTREVTAPVPQDEADPEPAAATESAGQPA